MDHSLVAGALRGGATREESAVLRALARSYAEGTHERFIWFASEGGVVSGLCTGARDHQYFVLPGQCTCAAGINNQLCKHRVALCDLTGTLDRLVPSFYERFVAPGELVAA
jgi:hypothetical protein